MRGDLWLAKCEELDILKLDNYLSSLRPSLYILLAITISLLGYGLVNYLCGWIWPPISIIGLMLNKFEVLGSIFCEVHTITFLR